MTGVICAGALYIHSWFPQESLYLYCDSAAVNKESWMVKLQGKGIFHSRTLQLVEQIGLGVDSLKMSPKKFAMENCFIKDSQWKLANGSDQWILVDVKYLLKRETVSSQTSDMGKKTVSVLAHIFDAIKG